MRSKDEDENRERGRSEEGKKKKKKKKRERERWRINVPCQAECEMQRKLCRVCFTDMRHTEDGATAGDLPIRVLYKSSSTGNHVDYYLY